MDEKAQFGDNSFQTRGTEFQKILRPLGARHSFPIISERDFMCLKDCVLEADMFVVAPFKRDQPEERWIIARDSGAIPSEL